MKKKNWHELIKALGKVVKSNSRCRVWTNSELLKAMNNAIDWKTYKLNNERQLGHFLGAQKMFLVFRHIHQIGTPEYIIIPKREKHVIQKHKVS
jgi:hypothetical protein